MSHSRHYQLNVVNVRRVCSAGQVRRLLMELLPSGLPGVAHAAGRLAHLGSTALAAPYSKTSRNAH